MTHPEGCGLGSKSGSGSSSNEFLRLLHFLGLRSHFQGRVVKPVFVAPPEHWDRDGPSDPAVKQAVSIFIGGHGGHEPGMPHPAPREEPSPPAVESPSGAIAHQRNGGQGVRDLHEFETGPEQFRPGVSVVIVRMAMVFPLRMEGVMAVAILLEGMIVLLRKDLGQAAPAHERAVAGPQESAVISDADETLLLPMR